MTVSSVKPFLAGLCVHQSILGRITKGKIFTCNSREIEDPLPGRSLLTIQKYVLCDFKRDGGKFVAEKDTLLRNKRKRFPRQGTDR